MAPASSPQQAPSALTILDSPLKNTIGPDSSWSWTMVQALGVAISLWLIYRQLRAQRLANTLATLKAMDERWNAGRLAEARSKIVATYPTTDVQIDYYEEDVLTFFEELEIYAKRGAFDVESVWNLYSYYIEHYWPILEQKVRELRAVEQDTTYYENAEWLYKRVCKFSTARKAVPAKTSDQLAKFIEGERTFSVKPAAPPPSAP